MDENSPNRIREMSSTIPLFINIYNSIYKVATLNWWDQYWTKEQDGKRFQKKEEKKQSLTFTVMVLHSETETLETKTT